MLRKIKLIGDAVMIQHTLFSLPFAAMAILLETGGRPPLKESVLILIAAAAGRNAANALNRVVDADIDKKNARTASRHIPQGLLSKKSLFIFSLIMGATLVAAAFCLNWLCVLLLPIAAILIGGYSFTKRWTWLCHYWLGLACSCSVMGPFVALSGRFALRYFVLTAAHCLWVAGFDIVYALQDIEFDRKERLHSIPARFGAKKARLIAALSHAGTLAGLFSAPLFWHVSSAYFIATGIAAILLVAEHIVALNKTERRIRIASYSINEVIPIVIFVGALISTL
ncbi:MAG: putative 4-hydroxybenzoate polyprenyltransferase [Treponema sp.]|jgi:4-hydroxybenzoate polyprenyltransferase|nr:putative 4-hydroxybenzoate polyprenyltransferase [Treponema sp.]